jgi:hypothetical protein
MHEMSASSTCVGIPNCRIPELAWWVNFVVDECGKISINFFHCLPVTDQKSYIVSFGDWYGM